MRIQDTNIESGAGLIIWNALLVLLIITIVYFSFRLLKMVSNYIKLKTSYLEKRIEQMDSE